ncbi:MAG: hypothetical protein ACRC1H_02725 [Caldilineaceae bacterium]
MREVLVNEEVQVLWRTLPSGQIRPTSFIWRDRSRYVSELGRAWEERVAGRTQRCFLLQAVDGSSYELRWDPGEDAWRLHRAWLRDAAA